MSHAEEQLFYACSEFCSSFFHLLCEKEKMRSNWRPDDEKDAIMRFEEERFVSAYTRLFKSVEDYENDRRGVVGENQYFLKLEKKRR